MFRPLLLAAFLASDCDTSDACRETYRDVSPTGEKNEYTCPHADHKVETENILEGTYVRRVKVICRCSRGKQE